MTPHHITWHDVTDRTWHHITWHRITSHDMTSHDATRHLATNHMMSPHDQPHYFISPCSQPHDIIPHRIIAHPHHRHTTETQPAATKTPPPDGTAEGWRTQKNSVRAWHCWWPCAYSIGIVFIGFLFLWNFCPARPGTIGNAGGGGGSCFLAAEAGSGDWRVRENHEELHMCIYHICGTLLSWVKYIAWIVQNS